MWAHAMMMHSAKWKYKICAIALAVLMCYMIFGAVLCAIQAARQGGEVYRIMLFSIIATYGGEFLHLCSSSNSP